MINRNEKQFGHKDLTVVWTPLDGPNARKPFTWATAESVKLDAGPKAATMKGLSVGPVAVTAVAAEPSGEMKISVANESTAWIKHLGNVGNRFTSSNVWSTSGKPSVNFEAGPCIMDGGVGFDSSADAPPTDTPKYKPVDIKIDGVSVYPKAGQ
jgi:hypothetical protein